MGLLTARAEGAGALRAPQELTRLGILVPERATTAATTRIDLRATEIHPVDLVGRAKGAPQVPVFGHRADATATY
jgi:hypothetical protein